MAVLEQESRLAFNIPAIYVNRFSASATSVGLRLTFGEIAPGETKAFQFHTAVLMKLEDAALLRNAISELLEKLEAMKKS